MYVGEYGTTKLWQFNTLTCTGGVTAPGAASLDGYVAVEPDGAIVTSGSTGSNTHTFLYNPSSTSWTGFDSGGDYVTTDSSSNIWKFGIIGGTTNDSLYIYPEAGGSSTANFFTGGLTQSGYSRAHAPATRASTLMVQAMPG